jgi:chromosome segregation ATPase
MTTNPHELHDIKTDIALIKRDITQISHVYKKVDDALDRMAAITQATAVSEKVMENTTQRIVRLERTVDHVDEDLNKIRSDLSAQFGDFTDKVIEDRDRRHKETMEAIDALSKTISDKLRTQEERIASLERDRWYVLGGGAVIIFILTVVPWSSFL